MTNTEFRKRTEHVFPLIIQTLWDFYYLSDFLITHMHKLNPESHSEVSVYVDSVISQIRNSLDRIDELTPIEEPTP